MRVASFISGGFTTITVINLPEKKTYLCLVARISNNSVVLNKRLDGIFCSPFICEIHVGPKLFVSFGAFLANLSAPFLILLHLNPNPK